MKLTNRKYGKNLNGISYRHDYYKCESCEAEISVSYEKRGGKWTVFDVSHEKKGKILKRCEDHDTLVIHYYGD